MSLDQAPKPGKQEQVPDVEFFSPAFIVEQISIGLNSSDEIKEIVRAPKVTIDEKGVSIDTKFKPSESTHLEIDLKIGLVIENGKVKLKEKSIKVAFLYRLVKSTIEEKLFPMLDKIPGGLIAYIEETRGKKVANISIENGQLKVDYESVAQEATEMTPEQKLTRIEEIRKQAEKNRKELKRIDDGIIALRVERHELDTELRKLKGLPPDNSNGGYAWL